ncbi:MAG: iron ABC transporter permease [Sphingomonadales bacterium]|nr:iron ABC transporter permease [Sphingomonadales bacterium]
MVRRAHGDPRRCPARADPPERPRVSRVTALLLAALVLALPLSLLAGRVWIDPFHDAAGNALVILVQLRAPRAALALVVGGGLGAAGAAMQGYLRNPLADPGLFGIAPSAALGAVLSLWLGAAGALALPLFALAGAAAAMALLALIAGRAGDSHGGVALFTLAGMMIASLAGALMSLAISLSPSPFALSEIVLWLMGALADRSWQDVLIAAPPTVLGLAALLAAARSLDALTLGDLAARSLGVDPRRLQFLVIAGVGLTVGAGVAVAGIIGFVGLMVPHLVRPFTDRRPSSLLVSSALGGALLLLVADCLCRLLPLAEGELRLGVALSLLGAPFFLALLLRLRRGLA